MKEAQSAQRIKKNANSMYSLCLLSIRRVPLKSYFPLKCGVL